MMRNVLIVDDNALLIEGICKNINWALMNSQVCATLTNGKQVLEMLSSVNVDLIISDIRMPGMTGLEMAQEILTIKPRIKVILISAYDDFNYAKEAIRIGAFDYVEKPIDYIYLSKVIGNALAKIDQEEKLLVELNNSRVAMEQKFFYDLLDYTPNEAKYHLLSNAEYLAICITQRQYLCAVIQIQTTIEVQQQFGMQHYHLLILDLAEEIKKRFAGYDMHYCLMMANKIIVILGCCTAEDDSLSFKATEKFTDLCECYINSCLSFSIGIGEVVPDFWEIPVSYSKAKAALDYRFLFSERNVFNIQDIQRSHQANITFSDDKADELVSLLCQKNEARIQQFTEALSEELSFSGLDRSGVFAYIYALLAKLMKFCHEIGITAQNIQDEIAVAFGDLSQFKTSTQICSWLGKICLTACASLQNSVESHHGVICEKVMKYIEQNYANPTLCLHDIAAFVNISPHHLSAIFKKTKGQNITDLITTVRIDMAQTLLKTTNISLKEISEKVGYTNQYYFSACFKKRTGTAPSTFRDDYLKHSQGEI